MKTAISVPDDTFDRATQRAAALGMSRSEFFSRAARRYVDELEAATIAAQVDAALDRLGEVDASAADAVEAGHRLLAADDDTW